MIDFAGIALTRFIRMRALMNQNSSEGYQTMTPIEQFTEILYRAGVRYERDGDKIEVKGSDVDLRSLTEEAQKYRGQPVRLRHVDGYTMLILSERSQHGTTISHAAYFGGGELGALRRCYIASDGMHNAHGSTVEKALRDLRFKAMEHDFDQDELVAEIKERGTVHIDEFRLITGACEEGTREGMAQAGLDRDADELPLGAVLAAVHGSYGDRFKDLFQPAAHANG